jgi:hypothetical protein
MAKANPLSLAELNTLMQRLEATLQILVGGGGRRVGSLGGGNGRRGPRRNRADGKQLQARLLDTLKGAKSGLSLGDVAEKVGGPKETVAYHLRVLRDAKKARIVGNRGTARWHAV